MLAHTRVQEAIFDDEDAENLVDIYAVIYGSMGFVCAIIGGVLADRLGIMRFTVRMSPCWRVRHGHTQAGCRLCAH